jgi:hypothetical protein
MRTTRTLKLGLGLVAAVALVAASVALAASTNNPQYKVAGAILGSGNTRIFTVTQVNTQTLKGTGLTIECTGLKAEAGATIIGSAAPNPGTSKETLEYSGCTVKNFPKCKVNGHIPGEIKTQPLINKLAFETKAAAEKEKEPTVTVLTPEAEKEPKFALFTLTEENKGTKECPLTGEVGSKGSVALKNVAKAEEETETHELEGTEPALKAYWLNEGGESTEHKVRLEVAGLAATYVGKSRVTIAKTPWSAFN